MKLGEFVSNVRRLLRKPPFLVLQTLVAKIPFCPITLARLDLLCYDGIPALNGSRLRGPGYVRQGTPEDIDGMVQCENKRAEFERRFASEDHCVVAVVDGKVVGYEWFCDKSSQFESIYSLKIEIPPDCLYAYDAYIVPEYRLRGFWLKFKEHLGGLMKELGRHKVITVVERGNVVSVNTHLRFGFRPFKRVNVLKMFGRTLFFEKVVY